MMKPTNTSIILVVIGIFSVILVTTNIFYLPSLGFLAGPTSQYQAALEEFTGQYYTSYTGQSPSTKKQRIGSRGRGRGSTTKTEDDTKPAPMKTDAKPKQQSPIEKAEASPEEDDGNEDGEIEDEGNDDGENKDEDNEDEEGNVDGENKDEDNEEDVEGNDDGENKDDLDNEEDVEGNDGDGSEDEDKEEGNKDDGEDIKKTAPPKIAGLNCDRFGGPSEEIASEMVYWRDIPSDAAFVSPYHKIKNKNSKQNEKQYLTFEPDEGGFNNIRMSMETATALAHAMGRILVLPPEQSMYLLGNDKTKENNRFTFHKFFPFEAISQEHEAVDVISMEEFLEQEVMTGNIKDKEGKPVFPPGNSTTFEGHYRSSKEHYNWLREVAVASKWSFSNCVVVFPEQPGAESVKSIQTLYDGMDMKKQSHELWKQYEGKPQPIDASPEDRLHEMLSFRKEICVYNETYQDAKIMHFMGNNDSGARLLVHFYAFLFFQDWKQDLWTKRYVRDHLRYIDAIQCGAASIVHAVRQIAKQNGNADGHYDSMHIRRGDFQYKDTRIPADQIYENVKELFPENATVFIATDEREKKFFDPLRQHYKLCFLDDFLHLLPEGFNKNYYGMLDQRVASRGRTFAGAYFSTFTGYIHRMRGYHSQKEHEPAGYLEGAVKSHYYVPKANRDESSVYMPLKGPLWGREFPTGWRDIDHDLHESHIVAR